MHGSLLRLSGLSLPLNAYVSLFSFMPGNACVHVLTCMHAYVSVPTLYLSLWSLVIWDLSYCSFFSITIQQALAKPKS